MTFTRLVLGEPRLRGKIHGGEVTQPCTEPVVYGVNILRDPGFETHSANVAKGPATDDFPAGLHFPGDGFSAGGANPGSLYWHTTNITDTAYYDDNGWAVWSNNVGGFGIDPSPVISDQNPRSGTYHWRVSYVEALNYGGAETYPIPVGGRYCDPLGGQIQGYSARCAEGDFVHASFYAMVNTTVDGPFDAWVEITFFDEAASFVSTTFTDHDNQSLASWTLIDGEIVAPAGAYTLVVDYGVIASVTVTSPPLHLDIDDCVLEVQP